MVRSVNDQLSCEKSMDFEPRKSWVSIWTQRTNDDMKASISGTNSFKFHLLVQRMQTVPEKYPLRSVESILKLGWVNHLMDSQM